MTPLTVNIEKLWDQKYRDVSVPFVVDGETTTAAPTTYYISNSGSDSNNGTSPSTPWQTIAKVNAATFNPGDRVLFQRGGTWRGTQLLPPSPGTVSRPITFGAYGSASKDNAGSKPILTGGVVVAGPWTNIGDQRFGETSVLTQTGILLHGFMFGSRFVVGQGGTLNSVTAYLDGAGGGASSQGLKAVVYANSSGDPTGAALGVSATVNITQNQAAGWQTFTFTPFAITAGTYHLAIQAGGTTDTARIYYQTSSATSDRWSTNSGGETLGSPPSSPAVTDVAGNYSIYATYTPTGATYSATVATLPSYVAAAGVTIQKASALNSIGANQWWQESGLLYLNLNGTDPTGTTVEYANLNKVLNAAGVESLVFENLDFRFSSDGGALHLGSVQNPILVRNCHFQNNGFVNNGGALSGLILTGGGRITGCTFNQNDNDCIWVGAAPDMEIDHNTITNMTGTLADGIQLDGNVYGGADGRYCSNYWVHHNTLDLTGYNGNKGCITTNQQVQDLNFYGGLIEYNTCNGGFWGVSLSNSGGVAQYNLIANCVPGTQPNEGCLAIAAAGTTQDQIMRYNVIFNCARGIYLGPAGSGPTNVQVYHNTVYGTAMYRAIWFETGATGIFHNNIFWCPSPTGGSSVFTTFAGNTVTMDYNLIGPEATNYLKYLGTNYSTLAAFQSGSSQETHGKKDDPTFVNTTTGDLHLQSGSPAIDMGTVLTGFPQDSLLGAGYDAGAHEYPRNRQIGASI